MAQELQAETEPRQCNIGLKIGKRSVATGELTGAMRSVTVIKVKYNSTFFGQSLSI